MFEWTIIDCICCNILSIETTWSLDLFSLILIVTEEIICDVSFSFCVEKENGLPTSSSSRIHHRVLAKTSAGKERNEKRNSTGSAVFSPVSLIKRTSLSHENLSTPEQTNQSKMKMMEAYR